MAKSRLSMNDYITEIKALERELNDEKTPQLVGSEQIVMKLSETNSRWDISITPYRQGQALSNDGWNVHSNQVCTGRKVKPVCRLSDR